MASQRVRTMPTVPAASAVDHPEVALPAGVEPRSLVWIETVAGGGYTSKVLARGTYLRLDDPDGDACVALLLHNADQTAERFNVADTVKVQWQAYPSVGTLLLSDLGRVMMAIVEDTSGGHDAFCGTSNRRSNQRRYGDGVADGATPNGRDRFAVALGKHGLDRRDIAPNLNLFKRVEIGADGTVTLAPSGANRGAHVLLRAEMHVIVTLVNVPHVLDDRDSYEVTPVAVTAWSGEPAAEDDPLRTATPERQRAYLNTEDYYGALR